MDKCWIAGGASYAKIKKVLKPIKKKKPISDLFSFLMGRCIYFHPAHSKLYKE